MPLTKQTVTKLRDMINSSCIDGKTGIPGVTVVVVDKNGNDIFEHSAGKRGVISSEPMSPEHIFWIASSTKMLVGLSCVQLVEKGLLNLDDGEHLEKLCPELKTTQVLQADGTLKDKNKAITLRMLLTHTSGFGYSFFNERLRDWSLPVGLDEFSGRFEDMLTPLLFQPGEGWEYGIGIDWAGIALERVTGLKLNDYLRKNIFEPLGLANMSMLPTPEMKSKLAYMHAREMNGTLRPRDHLLRMPLVVNHEKKSEVQSLFQSGGAGVYAKPSEYCKVLAVLLNDGKCPRTGVQLLGKSSVDEMFKNQIPRFPNFSRQAIPDVKPDLTNPIPELYPVPGNPPQGWGLTFMLSNGGATGRSKSTGWWAGLANCWWWCDRENEVAGMVCTQIVPFADSQVLSLWAGIEAEVYKALGQGQDQG
ncbi:beta-lactamase/transpeptidase-like protein [Biscogniauxia sp. FL1348]|nr:beta-lactamase/transpeptidase-like protein [Biscogniauxia sp. FL1348]